MSILKTIYLQHLNGSSPNATLDANGNMTVTGTVAGASSNMFRNRIINGDMRIDQRNAGASVTVGSLNFSLDRWRLYGNSARFLVQQNVNSVTPPSGFSNYLGVTANSSYTISTGDTFRVEQAIEGYNISDFGFGTAAAKPVTVSFWVRSSLTGTFGGALWNINGDRACPFGYSISNANTWEYKTITLPGDTTGTWSTTNTQGLVLQFSMGAGSTYLTTAGSWNSTLMTGVTGQVNLVATLGATWYVTGVQLEVGTTATPFERRAYGQELALCQRYYEKSYSQSQVPGMVAGGGFIVAPTGTNTVINGTVFNGPSYKATKRTSSPVITIYGYSGGTGKVSNASNGVDLAASSGTVNNSGDTGFSVYNNSGGSIATNSYGVIYNWTSDAEI